MDQHSIGEKSEPEERPNVAPKQLIEHSAAFRIPRFALPRLRHSNQVERQGSKGSDGPVGVTPFTQLINTQGNSRDALATPLPPNPFELDAGNSARIDVFKQVPLANIIVKDRLRGVVEALVPIMMDSLSQHEVIQPPVVRPDPAAPDMYILVSGLQRINAAKILGRSTMLCRVITLDELDAALWEVDENLARASLSPADEALFMARRSEVYALLHGKSNRQAKGAAAANAKMGRRHAAAMLARASFSEDTADRTGKSQRSIQRAIRRAAQNGPTTLARIARTALDTGAELDALPLLPHDTREQLIEQAAAGAEVSAVRTRNEMRDLRVAEGLNATDALSPLDSTEAEINFPGLSALKSAWLGASSSARENFLSWIMAPK